MAADGEGLTPKQRAFVTEYLVDLNATQAAIRAGYSIANADKIGPRLVGKSRVAAAIREAMRSREQRTGVTADRVVRELAVVAFSDLTRYEVDDTGRVVLREDAPPDAVRALSSVKRKMRVVRGNESHRIEDVEVEIKLWNKVSALNTLARHTGVLKDHTPLELLLASLPAELAGPLREALGKHLAGGGGAAGGEAPDPENGAG